MFRQAEVVALAMIPSATVEVIKNTPLTVNFATLYMSGKVILNNIFSLFSWVMILLYLFYRLGDLKLQI
jgi:hypothetical protein